MVTPSVGAIVLVPFPFSDLSQSKLRPAVVLADAGRDDWILCQVTSKPYGDPAAIEISEESLQQGGLQRISYARPGKLFTANRDLILKQVGALRMETLAQLIRAVTELLQREIKR